MSKLNAKEPSTVNIPCKPLGTSLKEGTKRLVPKPKSRHRGAKPQIPPKKQLQESSTQTEENCATDVNQLLKAAQEIYSFCYAKAGELLSTEKVLEESSKILQALLQLSKSFDFSDISEKIPFTKKLKEEVRCMERYQKRCRELVFSEELQVFLPKSKHAGGNLWSQCKSLLEEFQHRERKFQQAVLAIVESENLGKAKAEIILAKTDHKEQIYDLVNSAVEKQRVTTDQDKSELHEQYKDISIRQKNQIQKLEMKVEKFEEEKEKIREECREKVIEIQQDVIKCNNYWEREQHCLLEKQEYLESQRTNMAKMFEEEKQKTAQKDSENKKLQKLYHDTKEKLKASEKLNYNMSKARRRTQKETADKACSVNLKPETENAHCQTDKTPSPAPAPALNTATNPSPESSTAVSASENHFHGSINNITLYQIFPERTSGSKNTNRDVAQNGPGRPTSRLHISSTSAMRHQRSTHQHGPMAIEGNEMAMRSESIMSFANSESLCGDDC